MRVDGATVMVTGGTGFLGRYVSAALTVAGAHPVALGRADGDLRDIDVARSLLRRHRPDGVVHLAAVVGGIGANRQEPGRFFYDNALMGIQLLEACRLEAVPKVLLVGTACAYPGSVPVPTPESALWDGYPEPTNAPYGMAKRMLIVQAGAYRAQYGTDIVTVVPTNLYGPDDNTDLQSSHVIPALVRRLVEAVDDDRPEVVLWGDGTPTRDFLHVRDAARACVLALERHEGPTPINIASGVETSIATLAAMVAELAGYRGVIGWDPALPNGQQRRCLDISAARRAIGFSPSVALRDGLTEMLAWYRGRRHTAESG